MIPPHPKPRSLAVVVASVISETRGVGMVRTNLTPDRTNRTAAPPLCAAANSAARGGGKSGPDSCHLIRRPGRGRARTDVGRVVMWLSWKAHVHDTFTSKPTGESHPA